MKTWSHNWLIASGAYPCFCSMKLLGVFLLPLDGMLVHRRSLAHNLLGFPNNSPVPIYIPGWREELREVGILPKNNAQCSRPGLESRPLALESSTRQRDNSIVTLTSSVVQLVAVDWIFSCAVFRAAPHLPLRRLLLPFAESIKF